MQKLIIKKRPTIAVDFDGVIHKYSKGWQEGRIYDEPMVGAKEALEKLNKAYRIIVFTTRERIGIPPEIGIEKDTKNVWWWLNKHDLSNYIYEVTNKKPLADFYIDDRAIRFSNWDEVLEQIKNYEIEQCPTHPDGKSLKLPVNTPIAKIENPLQAPARYNLKTLFQQLKAGRPKKEQEYLDECIGKLKKSLRVITEDDAINKEKEIVEEDFNAGVIKINEFYEAVPEVGEWLSEFFNGYDIGSFVLFLKERINNAYRIYFFTEDNQYSVYIVPPTREKPKGYLSGTFSSKTRRGEDHTRGGDMTDGSYSQKIFQSIINDIARHELKPLEVDIFGEKYKVKKSFLFGKGKLLVKSQMNLFGKPESHHEGETVQGKHGQLIVKKNASGRGGHLEYVSKNDDRKTEEVKKKKYSTDLVKAKAISLETAYNTLSKKEGCKVVIMPKDTEDGMFGNNEDTVEGSLKTVNINSDGVLNIFIEAEEGEQIIKVPESQAIATGNNRILIQYKDRDVLIDLAKQPQIIEEDENESVINNETVLLPYQIADTVLANKMDVKSAEDEREFDEILEKLVKLADQEYVDSPKFKKLINGNKGRDELEVFFEKHIEELLKEKEAARTKDQVRNDNQLQIEIMQKAGIPEEEMVNYALSSVADGKILRTYINEVKSGEIDVEEAANRVKNDFDKMKSGEKEGEYIEPSEAGKEKSSINKPKLVLNYKKAI